jgi:hypothetical protein
MAKRADDIHIGDGAAHDGSVTCCLCSARDAGQSAEWCDVASGLLCDGCCDGIQEGDPERLVSLIVRTHGSVRLNDAIETCLVCVRMATHVVRNAPGAEAVPPC